MEAIRKRRVEWDRVRERRAHVEGQKPTGRVEEDMRQETAAEFSKQRATVEAGGDLLAVLKEQANARNTRRREDPDGEDAAARVRSNAAAVLAVALGDEDLAAAACTMFAPEQLAGCTDQVSARALLDTIGPGAGDATISK